MKIRNAEFKNSLIDKHNQRKYTLVVKNISYREGEFYGDISLREHKFGPFYKTIRMNEDVNLSEKIESGNYVYFKRSLDKFLNNLETRLEGAHQVLQGEGFIEKNKLF
mgnify:CR=1 FL=1